VGGRTLRVAIRPGTGTGPPLLLCNGIGMRLEALRPFVDALDPAIEVIRFDSRGLLTDPEPVTAPGGSGRSRNSRAVTFRDHVAVAGTRVA